MLGRFKREMGSYLKQNRSRSKIKMINFYNEIKLLLTILLLNSKNRNGKHFHFLRVVKE